MESLAQQQEQCEHLGNVSWSGGLLLTEWMDELNTATILPPKGGIIIITLISPFYRSFRLTSSNTTTLRVWESAGVIWAVFLRRAQCHWEVKTSIQGHMVPQWLRAGRKGISWLSVLCLSSRPHLPLYLYEPTTLLFPLPPVWLPFPSSRTRLWQARNIR